MMSVIMFMSPVNESAKESHRNYVKRNAHKVQFSHGGREDPWEIAAPPALRGMLKDLGKPEKELEVWCCFWSHSLNLKPIHLDRQSETGVSVRACSCGCGAVRGGLVTATGVVARDGWHLKQAR